MGVIVGFITWLAYMAFALLQLMAAVDGMIYWWGMKAGWAIALGIISLVILPTIGSLLLAIVGYIGVTAVWGWEWWQAFLVIFPGVVLSFLSVGVAGVATLFRPRNAS